MNESPPKPTTIYAKINLARAKVHATKLVKSGENAFAKYDYFELRDFLPVSIAACNEAGICGIVSFDLEFARLKLVDVETKEFVEITSPMSEANVKGCQPIQNLGAAETYQRRYLWQAAMEISESDAVESAADEVKSSGSERNSELHEGYVMTNKLVPKNYWDLVKSFKTAERNEAEALIGAGNIVRKGEDKQWYICVPKEQAMPEPPKAKEADLGWPPESDGNERWEDRVERITHHSEAKDPYWTVILQGDLKGPREASTRNKELFETLSKMLKNGVDLVFYVKESKRRPGKYELMDVEERQEEPPV